MNSECRRADAPFRIPHSSFRIRHSHPGQAAASDVSRFLVSARTCLRATKRDAVTRADRWNQWFDTHTSIVRRLVQPVGHSERLSARDAHPERFARKGEQPAARRRVNHATNVASASSIAKERPGVWARNGPFTPGHVLYHHQRPSQRVWPSFSRD